MATHAPARLERAAGLHGIYAILGEEPRVLEQTRAILGGGVRIVQYRAKSGIVAETLRQLREITREHGALLIVNDDWRAARDFDCDGAHLGPGDDGFADVARVRAAMPERLIGLSCGTLAEVQRANAGDVDYIGAGCVFATRSKGDAGAPIGIDGLRRLARAATPPVAAIGGIDLARLAEVRATGVAMAALISALANADEPGRSARELVVCWDGGA
ncbi:MAG TPA: thiamine phosphate synthase [Candidatus Binatia bacterium]|nr:thiamine phosphate synthase [Candidatus Binatia bacterium]